METRSYTRKASEIEHLYEESDEYDDEESESEFEDTFEEQSHRSESEEEEREDHKSESSDNEEGEGSSTGNRKHRGRPNYLRGKNGFKWLHQLPGSRGKRNRPVHTSSPIGQAATVKTPLEAWSVLFDDIILEIVLKHTNEKINRHIAILQAKDGQLQSYHKTVNLIELKATIGLLYFAGLYRMNHTSTACLWSSYSMSIFRITMSEKRFKFLILCMRFDDKSTRHERKITDKFANLREVWDKFINNCKDNYNLGSLCTIDEQLLSFRGRCSFRIYLPAKPDKYGLKVVTLNDAATHYLYNAIPYCGAIVDKNGSETIPSYYLRRLSEPIYHTGRNITCDGWFTSIPICDKLLQDYNLTMVGTVHKNKPEIPSAFKVSSKEEKVRFAYNDKKILVLYNPKGKKIVLLLSSYHKTAKVGPETGKPEIVDFYNNTKGGTDSFDQKCHHFSTTRRTRRWPMRYFYGMLDQANVNSFIIYNSINTNCAMRRRDYSLELCMSLIKPLLQIRLTISTLRSSLRSQIECFLNEKDFPEGQDTLDLMAENKMLKYKRCGYCPSNLDRKTCYKCLRCGNPMCKEHVAKICMECSIQLSN